MVERFGIQTRFAATQESSLVGIEGIARRTRKNIFQVARFKRKRGQDSVLFYTSHLQNIMTGMQRFNHGGRRCCRSHGIAVLFLHASNTRLVAILRRLLNVPQQLDTGQGTNQGKTDGGGHNVPSDTIAQQATDLPFVQIEQGRKGSQDGSKVAMLLNIL
jgi:hypothetical protein